MEKTKTSKDKTIRSKETGKTLKTIKEGNETSEKIYRGKEKLSKLDLKKPTLSPEKGEKGKGTADRKIVNGFPNNINEFRHIIDTFKVNHKELEWVLQLRNHKPAVFSPEKGLTGHAPNFSGDIDYDYKRKDVLDTTYRGVSTDLDHLMRKRIGEQANHSQLEFETTLRGSKDSHSHEKWGPWGVPKKLPKDHIESFLPPVTKAARRNFEKNTNFFSRPYNIEIAVSDW